MGRDGHVILNPRGVDQMLHEVDLTPQGERVLSAAEASAPVLTGAYAASLHLDAGPDGLGVVISSDVPYAIYVEANTGNLVRALGAAG